jgi:hypothetical protein
MICDSCKQQTSSLRLKEGVHQFKCNKCLGEKENQINGLKATSFIFDEPTDNFLGCRNRYQYIIDEIYNGLGIPKEIAGQLSLANTSLSDRPDNFSGKETADD